MTKNIVQISGTCNGLTMTTSVEMNDSIIHLHILFSIMSVALPGRQRLRDFEPPCATQECEDTNFFRLLHSLQSLHKFPFISRTSPICSSIPNEQ